MCAWVGVGLGHGGSRRIKWFQREDVMVGDDARRVTPRVTPPSLLCVFERDGRRREASDPASDPALVSVCERDGRRREAIDPASDPALVSVRERELGDDARRVILRVTPPRTALPLRRESRGNAIRQDKRIADHIPK